jgi:hypothetical protein
LKTETLESDQYLSSNGLYSLELAEDPPTSELI